MEAGDRGNGGETNSRDVYGLNDEGTPSMGGPSSIRSGDLSAPCGSMNEETLIAINSPDWVADTHRPKP